jgi:para-nitrobenzyl esterase
MYIFFAALFSLPTLAFADPALVATTSGTARGIPSGATISFLGLPYAAVPVAALRFAPTQPPAPWTGEFTADHFGAACPQPSMFGNSVIGNEDCLTLNVWRPVSGSKLPMMVFFHGGGNSVGSSHDLNGASLYDGAALSEKGPAVIVTINYRLGALGFLAHPALSNENTDKISGNYALLDQLQALHWIRDNAAAFGGDPANVTVFGESAGAIDILALLASPRATGLFQRAIIESGFLTEQPLAAAEADGNKFAAALGCRSAACLREKSAEDIVKASSAGAGKLHAYAATIDGHILPTGVLEAFRSGRASHVSLLIGTNADEMTTLLPFLSDVKPTITASGYEEQLTKDFGPAAPAALALYPASNFLSPYVAYLNVATDSYAHCPARRIARSYGSQVYKYVFTHVSDNPLLAPYGAGHGLELPFVFHAASSLSFTELSLSEQVMGYWTNFARTGNPNGDGLVEWKPFSKDEFFEINSLPGMRSGFREAKCDFWDSLGN